MFDVDLNYVSTAHSSLLAKLPDDKYTGPRKLKANIFNAPYFMLSYVIFSIFSNALRNDKK